jgi:ABC-2 type transport system permease protein
MTAHRFEAPAHVPRGLAAWLRIWAVARRHAYVLYRSPHRLFDVTVWPIVDTVLFGSFGVYFVSQGGPDSAAQAGVAYLLSGIALFGLAKLVMGVGVVALAAFVLYSFDVTSLGLALFPVIAILMVGGWAIALFVVGLILRFGNGAEALAWGIMFVVMPLGGVFYPVEALPAFIRPISALLPTTYAFAAGRELIDGGPVPWGELALAAIGTLVAVAAALAFVAWMLRLFRRRGYVTRYS